ncbi:MAG: head-tail connector protein [Pseudohongiellaceae bacterium]|nr:head-tail connector protein [Pseudohongiellaceae bacterium]
MAKDYLLALSAAADSYPVTSDQVKADLKIEHSAEDELISDLISAATEYVSEVIGKKLITQTWALSLNGAIGRVDLPIFPVQSIASITYYDTDDESQSLTTGNFYLYSGEDWAYIEPKSGVQWPAMFNRLDALTITFVAGFGAADAVPPTIARAIRLLVAHWYRNRSPVTDKAATEIPLSVDSLLSTQRKGWAG